MNNYHRYLKLPQLFVPPKLDRIPKTQENFDPNLLGDKNIEFLKSKGISLLGAHLFYLDPTRVVSRPIHVDGFYFDHMAKINYVFSDTPSYMNWYRIKENRKDKLQVMKTIIDTPYIFAEECDCDLMYSAEIGQPSLINAGELHGVSPVTSPRFCYSFMLQKGPRHPLRWDEAVELLKDVIV